MKLKLPKRNRTPLGRNRVNQTDLSPRSNFAYSSSRVEDSLNTGRGTQEKAKPIRFSIARLEAIAILLLFIVLVYKMLYVSPNVQIKPLISGDIISSSETIKYQMAVNKAISSSLLNKNKLTFNSSSVVSKIISQYPQVQSVSIKFGVLSDKPIVYIDQTQGLLIIKNASSQYFSVNLLGKAIRVASNLKDLNLPGNIPVINDQSGYSVSVNHQALPSNDVAFIQTVNQELHAKSVAVSSYTLPASTRELDVGITGQSYTVKFNLENNDPRQQAGTYLATIAQLKAQNITPSKYIDVRVDGRAYYQ